MNNKKKKEKINEEQHTNNKSFNQENCDEEKKKKKKQPKVYWDNLKNFCEKNSLVIYFYILVTSIVYIIFSVK